MAENQSIKMIKIGGDSGTVDVVNDYSWSVSNKKLTSRKEVPQIHIKEFQQTVSSIRQSMTYLANQATGVVKGQVKDPYAGLYAVDKSEPGNYYVLPYYNQYHHNIQNAWGENKGSIGQVASEGLNVITNAAKVVFPSAGIEGAKSWEGSQPSRYNFSFYLLNTVNPSVDIERNRELIRTMINNNLMDKIDFIAIRPPALCEIKIPGIRGTTVGVMENINIQNMGQLNYYGETIGNVPDAFMVTVSIQELLVESRQIYADELKGGKVFADIKQNIQGAQDIINQSPSQSGSSVLNTFKSIAGGGN